jgi:hypothetical protein
VEGRLTVAKRGRRAKRPTELLFPDLASAAKFAKHVEQKPGQYDVRRKARRVCIRGVTKADMGRVRELARLDGGEIVLASEVGKRAQAQCKAALGRIVRVAVGRSSINERARVYVVGEITHAEVVKITEEGRPLFSIEITYGPDRLVQKSVVGKIPGTWSGDYTAPRKRRLTMAKGKRAKAAKKGSTKKGAAKKTAKPLPEGDVPTLLAKLEKSKDADEKKLLRRALRKLGHKGGLRKAKTAPKAKAKKPAGKGKGKGKGKTKKS